jgi:hypothetical protein
MQVLLPGTAADSLVACAYLLWIVLTVAGLLRCRQIFPDLACIVAPIWPLFAPNPIVHDYDLAYRAKGGEGEFSPWKRLPMGCSRTVSHAVWNPGFAEQLFLFRLCVFLVELEETNSRAKRVRSRAYEFLLHWTASRTNNHPDTVQFMIVRCRPLAPGGGEVVFRPGNRPGADAS